MADISIIVPVHNVYDKLNECLDSICEQSLKNYECILVDDGSTDCSSLIIDEYAQMDARFIAIHQRNLGVGAARNVGLRIARGTFVTFIDSDDKIAPTFLENMLCNIGDRDILITGFTMCKPDISESIGTVKGMAHTENMAKAMKEGLLNSCWGKLYRRSTIQNVLFSEKILWGEDTAFLLNCLCITRKVIFETSHGYLYTYSTRGLANRFDKMKPFYLSIYYEQLILFLDHWAKNKDALYNEVCIKVSQEILRTVDMLIDNRLSYKEERQYLKKLFDNSIVNHMFTYGVQIDNNPKILKTISKFYNVSVWKFYLQLRRIF